MLFAGAPGFSSSITLSESAQNYKRILIEFEDSDGVWGSVTVDDPHDKAVCLQTSRINSTLGWCLKTRGVVIKGNSITTQLPSGAGYCTGEVVNGSSAVKDCIRICKVVGYRFAS